MQYRRHPHRATAAGAIDAFRVVGALVPWPRNEYLIPNRWGKAGTIYSTLRNIQVDRLNGSRTSFALRGIRCASLAA